MHMCRKNAASDQLLESSVQAIGAAFKHELHAKPSKLLETSGKKNVLSLKEGNSVKPPDHARLTLGSSQSKASISKARFGPDNSEILTTDTLYYSSVADSVVERELLDGAEVLGTGLCAVIYHLDNVFV